MSKAAARQRTLLQRLAAIEDGSIIRAAFYALLAGCAAVLYLDYAEMTAGAVPTLTPRYEPILPPSDPAAPGNMPGRDVTFDIEALKQPMTVALAAGGVLQVTGTIDPGAAARFAAEVAARGEYVTVVALDSPGGSVLDAMAMGTLIRERGFETRVADGAVCVSSCPLVFAGGTARRAGPGAVIGVHQIYATAPAETLPRLAATGSAISDTQKTTASITRHLSSLGIDTALWLHALDTPPERLYYLSAGELQAYGLVTAVEEAG